MYTKKSMKFNGVYFEDEIEGYTTIGVSGRERAEIETTSLSVGNRDGAIFRNNKYNSRTLTISFVLEGAELDFNADETELIERMNKLNALLDVEEEVQIIFRDEPDKFFMGIPTGSAEISRGLGIISGTFQIFCADPFKYSTEVYSATPVKDDDGYLSFVIDYDGTHKAYPTFEAQFYTQNQANSLDNEANLTETNAVEKVQELKDEITEDANYEYWRDPDDPTKTVTEDEINQMVQEQIAELYPADDDTTTTGNEDELISGKGKCGYVALFDDDENILQFGNPDATEEPEEAKEYSKLINQQFKTSNAWASTISTDWIMNSISNLPNVPKDSSSNYIYNQQGASGAYFSIANAYSNAQTYTLSTTFTASGTGVKYTITCAAKNRKSTSVDVSVKVAYKFSSAAPAKRVLKSTVTVSGTEKSKTIKSKTKKAWSKKASGSFTLSYTISDLTSYKDTLEVKFKTEKSGGSGNVGKCDTKTWTLYIPIYIAPKTDSYALMAAPESFVGTNKDQFYGPTAYRLIPKDVSNNRGWSKFTADFELEMAMNTTGESTKQLGALYVGVLTGDYTESSSGVGTLKNSKVLAGCVIQKASAGKTGIIYPVLDGTVMTANKISNIDLSYKNETFGPISYETTNYKTTTERKVTYVKKKGKKKKVRKVTYVKKQVANGTTSHYPDRHIVLTKDGDSFTFKLGGKTVTFSDKTALADTKAYAVFFGCFGYSGHPYLPYQGILSVTFQPSGTVSSTNYIPFTTSDFLYADASSGDIYLNAEERPDLGALGNDWEQMCLYPGVNQLGVVYSDWCGSDDDVAYRRQTGNDIFDVSADYYIKSGTTYSKVTITEETFNNNKSNYYILESCAPSFTLRYREVYV